MQIEPTDVLTSKVSGAAKAAIDAGDFIKALDELQATHSAIPQEVIAGANAQLERMFPGRGMTVEPYGFNVRYSIDHQPAK